MATEARAAMATKTAENCMFAERSCGGEIFARSVSEDCSLSFDDAFARLLYSSFASAMSLLH